jgi:hypothetical protein
MAVKRQSQSAILPRLAAFALIFLCAVVAAAPQARGSGPTLAITEFTNDGGAPQSTVTALGDALYAAIDQSGKYTAVGGGPLKVANPLREGDSLVNAIDAARHLHAEEIITTDLISVAGGTITYRLSAYRVDPLAFIRSQIFTQSSLAGPSLTAGFVTNLSTLHAPRTAVGVIYSLIGGVKADMGAASGFNLGDEFNVVRSSQKVAQAKITSIELDTATLDIYNASPGYKPQIGDQLVGIGVQPAVPPAPRSNPNTFNIIGILFATGAALLAVNHPTSGHAPPPPSPSPTSSGATAFTVSFNSKSGSPPSESFVFIFSQTVNTAGIVFTNNTYVSYEKTNGGTVITPAGTPVTNLGGPPPSFSGGNTQLTINSSTLNNGDVVIFSFTSAIKDVFGDSLLPNTLTVSAAQAHHPVPGMSGRKPVGAPGQIIVPAPAPNGGVPKPHPVPPDSKPKNPK